MTYGGYSGLTQRQELERRRQQQAAAAKRRRQAQKEAALRRQQVAEELRKEKIRRKREFKRYNDAATVIQRAFRASAARRKEEEEQEAAFVITEAVRRAIAVAKARRIAASLRRLHSTRNDVREICEAFQARPAGFRNNLYVVDRLEKLMFSLDAVETYGSPFVRAFRKGVVNQAQTGISFADVVMKTMRRKAAIIQRAVRQYQKRGSADRQDAAARVITRVVRAV